MPAAVSPVLVGTGAAYAVGRGDSGLALLALAVALSLQVAVNSYGVPPNCTGGDGAYRIDQPDDVAWLAQVLAGTDPRFGQ